MHCTSSNRESLTPVVSCLAVRMVEMQGMASGK